MMSEFVILDGKKKYQDFWLNMRNASNENFQTDLKATMEALGFDFSESPGAGAPPTGAYIVEDPFLLSR